MSTVLFDAIKAQSKMTDAVLVAFSGGKDSIVTLDLCFRYFKKVQPFFMYISPNLTFQEKTLQWYEKKYGFNIIRIPHFEVSNFMRYGSFREPDNTVSIISITEVYNYLREQTGIYWIAAGERINDSIVRRAMIKKTGSIDYKRGRFYPIAYWTKKEILDYIRFKKLKLGSDSQKLHFSFKSLDEKELFFLRENFLEDYQKVLKLYPYAGAAVKRMEHYGKKQISKL